MRKTKLGLFIVVGLLLPAVCKSKPTHYQELIRRFPYALLTSDHGILDFDDLKISQCQLTPSDFKSDPHSPYPRWQCFETQTVKVICEGKAYDSSEKSRMALLVVKASQGLEMHEFISRRVLRLGDCAYHRSHLRELMIAQKYVCISGEFVRNLRGATVWIYDRFKSKLGCQSYFVDGCSLKAQAQEGCNF